MMQQYQPGERKRPRRGQEQEYGDYVPKKKIYGQRPVDYFSSAIHHIKTRPYRRDPGLHHVPPHPYYCNSLLPVSETPFAPSTALCTQWVHTIMHPEARAGFRRRIYFGALQWSPNGRRLLAATNEGEFLLYNGHSFTFETRTVGHEDRRACKALAWGQSTDLILSGDDAGLVKVWSSNFVQVANRIETNQRAIREMAWGPGERKFVTAGQDGSARIWDVGQITSGGKVEVETRLEGHGGDVHTVDWHPTRAVVLTGSQDRDARLWDPRKGVTSHITTLQSHSQPLTSVRWHQNDYWFLTAARDDAIKLWDMRTMKEIVSYQGHSGGVNSVAWHPSHANLFTSVGNDGCIAMWVVNPSEGTPNSSGVQQVNKWTTVVTAAHDEQKGVPNPVSSVRWSPLGHVIATAAGEVKLWTRNKPGATEEIRGDAQEDIFS